MEIKLLQYTDLNIVDTAISKSRNKQVASYKVISRIDRIVNQYKHSSVIEHLVYSFDIDGISRACLQELARHRMASLSVKSTRYTLKELKKEASFFGNDGLKRSEKYLVHTGNYEVDYSSLEALEEVRNLIEHNVSNDIVKYCLPEAYKTSLVMTINARSLQNFLKLRSSKSALWEIRELALNIYKALPDDHKFLYINLIEGIKNETL